jgi:outer membrane cobalamin receptor
MMMRHPTIRSLLLGCSLMIAGRSAGAQVPGELRGRITDTSTVHGLASARIEITGRPEATRSNMDGSFTIRGLEPREYTLLVRALGYVSREVDVEVSNGRITTVNVALDRAATELTGVIVNAARDTRAAGVTTFDRSTIEASGRRDLGELLQTAPGVVITQAGGPGSASHVSIRGSGSNEVLVLVDGVPLNSAITGEADLSRISLEAVESVTIHNGAQSARYGSRALAGVIEIQTRRPVRDVSLLLRTGAWGERNASLSLGDSRPVGSMRVGGSFAADYREDRGDFKYDIPAVRGGGTAQRDNSDVTSRQALGSLSLDGDNGGVAIRGSWQNLSRGLAGSIVQPSATGREGQIRRDLGADGSWQRGIVSWTGTTNVTNERATFRDPAPPFGTAYNDTVNATAFTASSKVAVGDEALSASLGGEARGLDITSTMLTPGSPHWQRLLGAFGNIHLSQPLGASGTRAGLDVSARIDESSLVKGVTASPRIEASLSRGIIVASASLGSGYAPPSLADQFFHEGVQVQPNPSLQPERTHGDFEGRLAIHDAAAGPVLFSGEAAAYRSNIDGMILWVPDFRFIWSPSNFDVHRSGWELNGRAALPSAGVDVQGTLNRTDVVYTGRVLGGQVAYRPRTTGSVTAGLDLHVTRLEVTNQYVGERRTVPGSDLNVLDPYWRTDARLVSSWLRGAWRLDGTLGLENLFDRPAAMLVDYPFPGRSWTVSLRIRRAGARSAQ